LTLDDQAVRAAAIADPAGFIATLDTPVAIDEIQRVPELMTEIKLRVDRDKTPGQFVIPRFKAGALLYAGANTVSFGDRLAAVPLCGLWGP
jgi:uncharacterized protein